jgi:hypothetical protein
MGLLFCSMSVASIELRRIVPQPDAVSAPTETPSGPLLDSRRESSYFNLLSHRRNVHLSWILLLDFE